MIPVIAVQLGRIGDIINLLPACRHLNIEHLLCCNEFAVALKGQSYVQHVEWVESHENLPQAVEYAKTIADDVRVTQLHGFGREHFPIRTRPSWVMDQWDRLQPGFGDRWGEFPLVFDMRDTEAEQALYTEKATDKPMLLVNLVSRSSSFDYCGGPGKCDEVMNHLAQYSTFNIVNLGELRLERYCDLLGLYERAAGLITADTATLHLARAVPSLAVFQFTRPDPDCSPVIQSSQLYSCENFDKLDEFISRL